MPHWPSKTVATNLIKYVSKIELAFNPYITPVENTLRASAVRELLTRTTCERVKKSNPNLQISVDVNNRVGLEGQKEMNYINITFVDGSKIDFSGAEETIQNIEDGMYLRAAMIEHDYEGEGKSIE